MSSIITFLMRNLGEIIMTESVLFLSVQVCPSSFWAYQVHPNLEGCAEKRGANGCLWLRSWANGKEWPRGPGLVQAGAGGVPAETGGFHWPVRIQMNSGQWNTPSTCATNLQDSCSIMAPDIPWKPHCRYLRSYCASYGIEMEYCLSNLVWIEATLCKKPDVIREETCVWPEVLFWLILPLSSSSHITHMEIRIYLLMVGAYTFWIRWTTITIFLCFHCPSLNCMSHLTAVYLTGLPYFTTQYLSHLFSSFFIRTNSAGLIHIF